MGHRTEPTPHARRQGQQDDGRHGGRTPIALHFLQGLMMGGADVVPGVSGGTVALIVGIYEQLVRSVRAAASAPVALLRGDPAAARGAWGRVRWRLVLPLGAGIVAALGIGSAVLPALLERHPARMNALFFGLVAASLLVPWRRIRRRSAAHVGLGAGAALLAAVLVGLPPATYEHPSLLQVALSAAVAICAMILPGISGAFLLKILGIYEVTLRAVNDLDLAYVAVFVGGAAVGLGLFSKLLEVLLETRHDATMAVLVGLMAGSLRALWPWQAADRALLAPVGGPGEVALVAGLAVVGALAVTALVRSGGRTDQSLDV